MGGFLCRISIIRNGNVALSILRKCHVTLSILSNFYDAMSLSPKNGRVALSIHAPFLSSGEVGFTPGGVIGPTQRSCVYLLMQGTTCSSRNRQIKGFFN